jgi:hypothetical protein
MGIASRPATEAFMFRASIGRAALVAATWCAVAAAASGGHAKDIVVEYLDTTFVATRGSFIQDGTSNTVMWRAIAGGSGKTIVSPRDSASGLPAGIKRATTGTGKVGGASRAPLRRSPGGGRYAGDRPSSAPKRRSVPRRYPCVATRPA